MGVCAATIREAEAMSDAGIGGLLITGELVGENKTARLVRLTRKRPETMSTVDNAEHAEWLSEAAVAAKVELNIMVDIDPVGRRTGIEPGDKAVALAKKVDSLAGLKLRGVHGYSGASSHVMGFDDRKEHSEKYMGPVLDSYAAMKKAGLPVEIMSGASNGDLQHRLRARRDDRAAGGLLRFHGRGLPQGWRQVGRGSTRTSNPR